MSILLTFLQRIHPWIVHPLSLHFTPRKEETIVNTDLLIMKMLTRIMTTVSSSSLFTNLVEFQKV